MFFFHIELKSIQKMYLSYFSSSDYYQLESKPSYEVVKKWGNERLADFKTRKKEEKKKQPLCDDSHLIRLLWSGC